MTSKHTFSKEVRNASFFSGKSEETFSLPEDFTTLSDSDVTELHAKAVETFQTLYGDGGGINAETLETLSSLKDAVQALAGEKSFREEQAVKLAAEAAELASTVTGTLEVSGELSIDEDGADDTDDTDVTDESDPKVEAALSTKKSMRIPAQTATARRAASRAKEGAETPEVMKVVGDGLGLAPGTGANFSSLGEALDTRLKSFNLTQYQNAHNLGRNLREVGAFASISREFPEAFQVRSNDRDHVNEVIKAATDNRNLTPNSLLASGGWNAASEVLYNEFLQLEESTGALSTPEITLTRGGTQWTPGVSFAEIYAAIGFAYTEAEDIAGTYEDESGSLVVGPKPVYHLEVPEFQESRLDIHGLIIEAGLLAARGYPEYLADVIRKSLVAHYHKLNAAKIADIATGSTAITMPSQAGATAGILGALELQAEHYRDTHRMAPDATLEAVVPTWAKGLIRHDLSRRLGVDLISVKDARIAEWFTDRNLAPQFVQDYQSIATTAAASFTSWPSSLQVLLYAAGTWVTAKSDVITLDTLYDSTNLKNNDFTALFTEEGQSVLKIGTDSRKITIPITGAGVTHIGDEIGLNGTAV